MASKSKLIKGIVKSNEEKPSFGTNPRDPWSAKANISESALLNRYLKSRGINPEFVQKDQKVAHSKTNQFKVWARAHINDPVQEAITTEPSPTQKRLNVLKQSIVKHKEIRTTDGEKKLHSEAVDKKDTITFDIPLLIRVLEFAREELNSDINLHKMVERLISIRGKGTLTMNQYGQIVKEEFNHLNEEQLDEISKETLKAYKSKAVLRQVGHASKIYDREVEGGKQPDPEQHRQLNKVKAGIARADTRLNKEETVQEGSAALRFAQALKRERETRELKDATRKARETQNSQTQQKPVPTKEDVFQGSTAATQTSFDGANNPDDTIPAKRSNQARIVKSVVKKIKEELYDTEKEDKSTAPVGKKVKLQKPGVDAVTKESPQAAAILSGGKTMTGEPRDTIEIDPMMKMRKQSPESQKSV